MNGPRDNARAPIDIKVEIGEKLYSISVKFAIVDCFAAHQKTPFLDKILKYSVDVATTSLV